MLPREPRYERGIGFGGQEGKGSLTQLDLSFVQDDKYGSICILPHADIHFDRGLLLRMFSLFPCVFLVSYNKSDTHKS
ncbi:hypothetical protein STEG23_003172, partial [Scotinomys teguina]